MIGDYSKIGEYIAWKFDDKDFKAESWDKGYTPRGKCFYRDGYVPIIWIPHKPKTPREHATLAHECIHAVFHLFEWANLNINRETEEVMTHAVAHVYSNILSEI